MRIFLLWSIWLFSPFAFGANATALKGVWEGTIGTKAVTACFNAEFPSGSYYYKQFLNPIQLSARDNDTDWHEEKETGIWKLYTPVDGIINGSWRNPKTKASLPIQLRLIDGKDDNKACALGSYNSAIEKPPKIETGIVIQFSPSRSYRKLRFAGQETIELFGPDPAISRINNLIKLEKRKEAIDSYFQQRREFLGSVGYPAVDEQRVEPKYWDANFITIEFYLWVAGEGRGGISNDYRTWNTITGETVDLWTWLGSKSSEPRLPPRLQKYLFKNVKLTPECQDGYRGQGEFILTLGKSGLNIFEDAWGSGCEQSFFIPYTKLEPFLSNQGKLAIKALLNNK